MSPTDHHDGAPPEDRPPTGLRPEQPIQEGPAAAEDSALDPMLDEYTEVSRVVRPAGSSVEFSPQTGDDNGAEIARGEPSDEGHHTG
ncbi:hypothetical protein GCM10011374_36740 [Kocuria dechangensis]|uniref:Uncharacterized protein n=1 Tax=Kocuria dechangensis TaxID=1176249 RepID=A0A917H6C5_9MICC|nr:hypothetical protein [Kocuria dechangensis]GGG68963.1 hypothetical protein GCM10011374_36740 [Kocuria dechangensis]